MCVCVCVCMCVCVCVWLLPAGCYAVTSGDEPGVRVEASQCILKLIRHLCLSRTCLCG